MLVDVRFKKLDHSDSLVEYIYEKVEKLSTYCRGHVVVHFDISKQGRKNISELTFKTQLNTYHAQASSDNFYSAVDLALTKVLKQVKKHRQKLRMHKNYALNPEREVA
ncbi:MAG: ribosome-associated translation inhibitor RaiA [Bdellovibrionaceae bacterium]|nr:ribosome-associated translation inhibitor RaiA [Pseudobdellovibrionaceae bacterium]